MSDRIKKQRKLSRSCPECEGELDIISKTHEDDGVDYTEQYVLCSECGYSEKLKVSPKRCKDYQNPKW
jgi:Zn ribbon nucleic-acid-binding protein